MKFPRGNEIYNRTPSQLVNLKELVAWFRMEKFNGILIGESSGIFTEILIWDGIIPKAFTYRDDEIIAEDNASIEIFVNDFMARLSLISLFSLDKRIIDAVLIQYFSQPKIFQEEVYLFVPEKLIEESYKEGMLSHIFINLSKDKIHFLFGSGNFFGYYSEIDGILKTDLSILNDIFKNGEGLLSFYQISEEEFSNLSIPSLKFSFVEDEITKWVEKLLSYVNFVIDYYNTHGINVVNMEKFLLDLNLLKNSLVCIDNKFVLKKEITGSYEEVEKEVSYLLSNINRYLSDLWGKKLIYQKYFQAYRKFLEDNKKDPTIIELLDKLNPENIDF